MRMTNRQMEAQTDRSEGRQKLDWEFYINIFYLDALEQLKYFTRLWRHNYIIRTFRVCKSKFAFNKGQGEKCIYLLAQQFLRSVYM